MRLSVVGSALLSSLILSAAHARADEAPPSLEQRIEDLEQQHRILLRQLELEHEAAAEEAKKKISVSAGASGFVIRTANNAFALKLRGLVQIDGRAFFGDGKNALPDTFLPRRVRPIIEATFFGIVDVKIMPDFGNNTVALDDAYVDLHPFAWLRLRAGKMKPPIGLERLQSAANILFIERAFPTALVPNRDVGAYLWGEIANGAFIYQVGVFNGIADGALAPDIDLHDGKELVARVFGHPFRPLRHWAVENLGFGVAGSYGNERGTAAAPNLPTLKSPGQFNFFTYLADATKPDGTALAGGTRYRISPQLYWYIDRVGLMAEYVRSAQDVKKGTEVRTVGNQAWQVSLSVLLTKDKASYDGVKPNKPFDYEFKGAGAWELAARYEEITIDDTAFPLFADDSKSARQARGFGVALNWYLNQNARLAINYEHTNFTGGAVKGDRAPEDALLGRLQVSF